MSDLQDVLRIDNTDGSLVFEAPPLSWANLTSNISVGCFSELLAGDRGLDDLERCVEVVFSFLTLSSVHIHGFPLRWVWPWQDDVDALTANASLPALPIATAAAASADTTTGALHTTDDHVHVADDDGLYLYTLDLLWFFVLLGAVSLVCGACINDSWFTDADGTLYRNGMPYRRVKAGEAESSAA